MRLFLFLGVIVALCIFAGAGNAQSGGDSELVDLELVLAADVSRSMSPWELEIQRRGYAEALVSREVLAAIQGGLYGQIALTYGHFDKCGCLAASGPMLNLVCR